MLLVHEIGHSLTGKILGFSVKRIEIYPYGGCSKLEYDINTPIKKELLVLIMGPITQIIFVSIIYFVKLDVPNYFFIYHYFILIFNLLPIYPLDGGRLLNLILSYFVSYYRSLKWIFYFSYLLFIVLFNYFILLNFNLLIFIILILLGIKIIKEIKQGEYYYQKFLIERYLNNYSFRKIKKINKLIEMKKNYYHYFVEDNNIVNEKEKLSSIFIENNKKIL